MLARHAFAFACALSAAAPAFAELDSVCTDGPTPEAGIAACTAAIERPEPDAKDLSLAYSNRASWHWETGAFDAARADATEALAIDPANWRAYLNRANALFDLGRLDQALADYDRALELDDLSDDTRAYLLVDRGNALFNSGQYERALADYRKSAALVEDEIVYQNIGVSLHLLGDYEGSIAAHDKALAINPHHEPSITNRGELLEELGDFEGAMAAYERAMELDPETWVRETKSYMARDGHWDGPIDGALTPEFRAALEACISDPDC